MRMSQLPLFENNYNAVTPISKEKYIGYYSVYLLVLVVKPVTGIIYPVLILVFAFLGFISSLFLYRQDLIFLYTFLLALLPL